MKTIKELEAEIKFFNDRIKDKTYKIKGIVFTITEVRKARYKKQVEVDKLKEVSDLIDERIKKIKNKVEDMIKEGMKPSDKEQMIKVLTKDLQELKKRITG